MEREQRWSNICLRTIRSGYNDREVGLPIVSPAKIHATKKGPGPRLDLNQRIKALPKNMKMPNMTEGAASMYLPSMT